MTAAIRSSWFSARISGSTDDPSNPANEPPVEAVLLYSPTDEQGGMVELAHRQEVEVQTALGGQRQLGHADVGTTINLYGHLEESFLRDAAVRAEDAIWKSGTKLVPRGSEA